MELVKFQLYKEKHIKGGVYGDCIYHVTKSNQEGHVTPKSPRSKFKSLDALAIYCCGQRGKMSTIFEDPIMPRAEHDIKERKFIKTSVLNEDEMDKFLSMYYGKLPEYYQI